MSSRVYFIDIRSRHKRHVTRTETSRLAGCVTIHGNDRLAQSSRRVVRPTDEQSSGTRPSSLSHLHRAPARRQQRLSTESSQVRGTCRDVITAAAAAAAARVVEYRATARTSSATLRPPRHDTRVPSTTNLSPTPFH